MLRHSLRLPFSLHLLVSGIVVLLVVTMVAAAADPVVLYVSDDGNDAFSGRFAQVDATGTDGPLATVTGARDTVRTLRAAQGGRLRQPVRVQLRGGDYYLDQPVVFAPQDSGTAQHPIVYEAFGDERPRLSGGRPVTGWHERNDGVWETQLDSVRKGTWEFRQLFVRNASHGYDQRRYRPVLGMYVIAGLTDSPTFPTTMRHRQSQKDFRFFEGHLRDFANLEDVEVVALHDWSSSRLRIEKIDHSARVVHFTGFPVFRIGHWFAGGRNPYFLENVREAFTEPGTWYLDRPTGTLQYRPLPGETLENTTFIAPVTPTLIQLAGDEEGGQFVEHLQFRGIQLVHTHWALPPGGYSSAQGMIDMPAAFEATAARHCQIEDSTLAHLGAYAVRLGAACQNNLVRGCLMYDLGGGGVMVGLPQRSSTSPKTPSGNAVENCVISDGGLVHYSAHGVWVGIAAQTHVRHNVIRRFLYSNVSVGWSWNPEPTACRENVIEDNHIHDAMMLLADGGGIYTLGLQPGTVIRGNHIHAVHRSRYAGRAENNGIFFDQGSKDFLVEKNVIYDTANKLIRFNQSREDGHQFRNNTLGVSPDDPDFPTQQTERAGLSPEYRHLPERLPPVTTTPVLLMELQEPEA